jgi:hypothetical protein
MTIEISQRQPSYQLTINNFQGGRKKFLPPFLLTAISSMNAQNRAPQTVP